MTKNERMRESVAVIASTTLSAKNSCSGSPDMLSNGRTAIDGLSGNASAGLTRKIEAAAAPSSAPRTPKARTGCTMFFTACSPWSSNATALRLRCVIWTVSDTVMPPGSASASKRAAMLTPSPYTVPSAFSITSPRCTPIRNRIRRSSGRGSAACASSFCTVSAALTAPLAVSNTASTESPAMSTTRPWFDSISLRKMPRAASSAATVARSSVAMRREYPTASAARIAASRCLMPISVTALVSSERSSGCMT